jgi:hypothetical protein
LLYRGFYPRIHNQAIPPGIWLGDYIRTLVNIGDLVTFERLRHRSGYRKALAVTADHQLHRVPATATSPEFQQSDREEPQAIFS